MDSWSIVVTVKAEAEVINIFLQENLKKGPEKIFVFLDDPKDIQESDLIKDKRIEYTWCTPDFWKQRKHYYILRSKPGERPNSVEYRQYHNMLQTYYDLCESKWLLMIDIDEIVSSDRKIGRILSEYPENVFSVRAKPIEAVYKDKAPQNFSEVFSTEYFKSRNKINYSYWAKIYPEPALGQRSGFFGHLIGKTFLRIGEEIFSPSCHISSPIDKELLMAVDSDEIKIRHYESMTPEFFINKNINRINKTYYVPFLDKKSKDRIEYLKPIYESQGENGLKSVYNKMHVFDNELMNQLIHDGYVVRGTDKKVYSPKKNLLSHHGTELAVDIEKDIAVAKKHEEIDGIKFVPLLFDKTMKYDSIKHKGYFYCVQDNERLFLYVDRYNHLRCMLNTNKAQPFDIISEGNKLSFGLDGKYISISPKGEVSLKVDLVKSWELMTPIKIVISS